MHVHGRLGERELRTITPKVLNRFRADLEHASVGSATVVKAMALVQSILSFAVVEERVEFNAMAVVRKPTYERAREPHIFLPVDVEELRAKLNPLGAMLVSLLAYSGARPEEVLRLLWRGVGAGALLFDGQKTRQQRHTPLLPALAEDLRAWRLASGAGLRPHAPVIPAHDGAMLGARRLAQLAPAGVGALGPRRARPAHLDRGAEEGTADAGSAARHPAARPSLELHHRSDLRGHAAHHDREAGRHERRDDRQALRRRDRELGWAAGPRGGADRPGARAARARWDRWTLGGRSRS